VRLKDVRDVLLDTGLGTGGYSVMEQGRIDARAVGQPRARRAIFEEAAGIARFKLQKKEALRRLERTDQNLARATDLLEERTRRIRGLRVQAGKARRFQELQLALRDLRRRWRCAKARRCAVRVQQQEALAALQEAAGRHEAERAAAAAAMAGDDTAIRAADGALRQCRRSCRAAGRLSTWTASGAARNAQRETDRRAEAERDQAAARRSMPQRDERLRELLRARTRWRHKEAELIELHASSRASAVSSRRPSGLAAS
jgi:chromosome segregation protein